MNWLTWAREHALTAWLAAGLAAAVVAAVAAWAFAVSLGVDVARARSDTARMEGLEAEYRQWRDTGGPAVVRGEPLTLSTVERVARERQVASALTERSAAPVRGNDGTLEQTIKLTVTSVAPGALSGFLYGVEQLNPGVRVRELRISANRKQTGMIDANVVIAAYETPPPK